MSDPSNPLRGRIFMAESCIVRGNAIASMMDGFRRSGTVRSRAETEARWPKLPDVGDRYQWRLRRQVICLIRASAVGRLLVSADDIPVSLGPGDRRKDVRDLQIIIHLESIRFLR